MKKKLIVISVILMAFLITPAIAQPSDPPGGGGGGEPVHTDVPFGLEWLLAGGIVMGISKIKRKKNA